MTDSASPSYALNSPLVTAAITAGVLYLSPYNNSALMAATHAAVVHYGLGMFSSDGPNMKCALIAAGGAGLGYMGGNYFNIDSQTSSAVVGAGAPFVIKY